MKRATCFILLCILIARISISPAAAKGTADKISISGPGLMSPIQITDAQILQQYSPWDQSYLDVQSGALQTSPKVDRIYEVLLYAKDDKDQLQVRYAFQYVPGQPGFIYIPGQGDKWYDVNIGTIMLGSTIEGHWFYASKAWGDLMQHLLGAYGIPFPTTTLQTIYPIPVMELSLGGMLVLAGLLVWLAWRRRSRNV